MGSGSVDMCSYRALKTTSNCRRFDNVTVIVLLGEVSGGGELELHRQVLLRGSVAGEGHSSWGWPVRWPAAGTATGVIVGGMHKGYSGPELGF